MPSDFTKAVIEADRTREVSELLSSVHANFGASQCQLGSILQNIDCVFEYYRYSDQIRQDTPAYKGERQSIENDLLAEARRNRTVSRDFAVSSIPALRAITSADLFDASGEWIMQSLDDGDEFNLAEIARDLFEHDFVDQELGRSRFFEDLLDRLESIQADSLRLQRDGEFLVSARNDSQTRLRLTQGGTTTGFVRRPRYSDRLTRMEHLLTTAGGTFVGGSVSCDRSEYGPKDLVLLPAVTLVKESEREVRELEDVGLPVVSGSDLVSLIVAIVVVVAILIAWIAGMFCRRGRAAGCTVAEIASIVATAGAYGLCIAGAEECDVRSGGGMPAGSSPPAGTSVSGRI